ncbi:MAG: DNA polymerase-3 subunit delta' [Paracoccaceae bacterium]|jgi:DNA polymerase-3 subunit delta'
MRAPIDAPPPPQPDQVEGAPHPRAAATVFGHAAAEATFLEAYNSDRLHHAWLLTGPRGIGKATLAWRMARFLLATPPTDGGFFAAPVPDSLDIAASHPVNARLAALSEPGLMLLRRPWDAKTQRLKQVISVDEVRRVKSFFSFSATDGGRRVVIVDAADEMNISAANALLKVLEEPPKATTLLLVCHQPMRLLPTIRSRCRTLRLGPLDGDQMALALTQAGIAADNMDSLAELADGSVGDAVRLIEQDGLALYRDLVGLLATLPRLDRTRARRMADGAAARGAEARFELLLNLADRMLTRLSKQGATGIAQPQIVPGEAEVFSRLAPNMQAARDWADLAQSLTARARRGKAVNLDPAALILDMFLQIDQTAARLPA